MEKHPDVIAWDNWAESHEGKKVTKPYEGILERQYLENRLKIAFFAARKSANAGAEQRGRNQAADFIIQYQGRYQKPIDLVSITDDARHLCPPALNLASKEEC